MLHRLGGGEEADEVLIPRALQPQEEGAWAGAFDLGDSNHRKKTC